MHLGAQIIKRHSPDILFLTKEPSPLHYAYNKKKLSALMVFDNNTKIVDRQSKAPIPVAVVDKIRGVCKKNKIKGFFIFVNVKKDIMTRVKVSDENGEIPCSHKVTRRDGQLVNYLIDLSDERCVIFRQCSSI